MPENKTPVSRSWKSPLIHTLIYSLLYCGNSNVQATESTPGNDQLQQLQQQIDSLKQQIDQLGEQPASGEKSRRDSNHDRELDISGFFDVTAHTTNHSEHPFDLGSLELDIQYDQVENFAMSTALVWDGDTSEVAVAVLDYHVRDHDVPSRGPLFTQPGFHVQFGRFDIPFGIDYEFFAAPDRPNITAPLTTQRMQNDGFNGDGVRVYGACAPIDCAWYWTNSLFENNGSSLGARISLFPNRSAETVQQEFDIGLSWLRDMDSRQNRRKALRALDMRWRYRLMELIVEYIDLDSIDSIILPGGANAGVANERGYNSRLLLDFDPLSAFIGYGEWRPEYTAAVDADDPTLSYSVSRLKRLTLGGRYILDDYLQIKLEYLNHLGSETGETDFEKRRLTFQMVASF